MRYAAYDPVDGRIIQWGEGEPPPGAAYVEHDIEGSLTDYHVAAGAVAPKLAMSLTLPGPTAADGVTEAVVSGLPVGTLASGRLAGDPFYVVVDDGTLELVALDPAAVTVMLRHPVYQHPPIEVVFV